MENVTDARLENDFNESSDIQVVAFRLGKEEYAVDILYVQEIVRLLTITRVPRAQKHIEGVVNLRGNIVPVINLHTRFNLMQVGDEDDKRIIVFQMDDIKAGIIVDEVSEVLQLSKKDIEETSNVYGAVSADLIKGIARVDDRLFLLLDLIKVLE